VVNIVHETAGMHHLHKRKRIYVKKEPYPHPNKWKRWVDDTAYVVGVLGPIMTIPQLTRIWIEKNASGVSVITWGAYVIGAFVWLVYGIVHREKPLIATYILSVIVYIVIVIGILSYG